VTTPTPSASRCIGRVWRGRLPRTRIGGGEGDVGVGVGVGVSDGLDPAGAAGAAGVMTADRWTVEDDVHALAAASETTVVAATANRRTVTSLTTEG
jgi:hypothetical protein